MKNKNKKIGNLYNNNNINIIGNNNRQNNFKRQQKNQNLYGGFIVNNYDSTRPIKLLNNPIYKNSTSTDKAKKSINFNNYNFYGQKFEPNKPQTNKIISADSKRPSTAPQKFKISKNKSCHVFGYGIKNKELPYAYSIGLPNTYSNGFFSHNNRLPSPMISGQKFGMSQKLKFNSYRFPLGNNNKNLLSFKSKKKSFN
jgi:hypothetical protein